MPQDKKDKNLNVPPLRFPGFTDEWETHRLSSYAKKITKKNKGNKISNVLCNSASLGIIPQSEYFDRDIANSENTDNYYIIEPGDFVYNPRKSVTAPYGPVNLYIGSGFGIISPLYLCFKVDNLSKEFLLHWFKGYSWHRYVYSHGDTGVRYDRVSIKDDVFLDMPISLPSICEQNKISTLLTLIDERIATQNKIIDDLQSLIKGLNDSFHDGIQGTPISFDQIGRSYSGLSGKSGDDFGQGSPFITYLNVYQNNIVNEKQIDLVAIDANESQNTVSYGDVLFTLSSETPEETGIGCVYLGSSGKYYLNSFCFGVTITHPDKVYPPYLAYLVSSSKFRKFVYPLAQGSTRFNLQKSDFMRKQFTLLPIEKQKEIATILDTLNNRLSVECKLNELYKSQKDYLLRKLFI